MGEQQLMCLTCAQKHENKILKSELKTQKEKYEKQIAMLQDGFEYQKNQADTYAKVLRKFENWLDCKISGAEENGDNYSLINLMDLEELKDSIPETALRRGE